MWGLLQRVLWKKWGEASRLLGGGLGWGEVGVGERMSAYIEEGDSLEEGCFITELCFEVISCWWIKFKLELHRI